MWATQLNRWEQAGGGTRAREAAPAPALNLAVYVRVHMISLYRVKKFSTLDQSIFRFNIEFFDVEYLSTLSSSVLSCIGSYSTLGIVDVQSAEG